MPSDHVQVDAKFLTFACPAGRPVRHYQYTAIDDDTRSRAPEGLRPAQEPFNRGNKVGLLQLALPEHERLPTHLLKRRYISLVPLDITIELFGPIFVVRRGSVGVTAAGVLMPEAAVYEDCGASSRKYDVRVAGEVFTVKAVAIASLVKQFTNLQLRLRALRLHGTHDGTSLLCVKYVHRSE